MKSSNNYKLVNEWLEVVNNDIELDTTENEGWGKIAWCYSLLYLKRIAEGYYKNS